jgi:hypothetical protein
MIIGLVLYNESLDFSERIRSIASLGYLVYVFDNSPDSEYARVYLDSCLFSNISYFTAGSNIGLARSMSLLCSQAYYSGHKTLFFLDQDTHVSGELINYVDHLSDEFDFDKYSALSISGDKVRNLFDFNLIHHPAIRKVKLIRNSGSLFNLKALHTLKWFDQSYFVDGVDYQFSLNSCLNGFSIGLIDNVLGFDHWSGQGYVEYCFFGISIVNREYSISRISDVTASSLKLIFRSFVNWRFDYCAIFAKNMLVFLTLQFILRISRKVKL